MINTFADFEEAYNKLLEENKRLISENEIYYAELLQLRSINQEQEKDINLYKSQLKKITDEYQELKQQYEIVKIRSDKFMPLKRQISDEQILEIQELRKKGLTFSQIRKKTGWSNCTISRALNGYYDR